ncbi:protein kinase domain-containing protein [Streptomyces sp. Wb2n-11]|uniref:serine/threonine-protein kinase n=1 Tax=Streptomyces sp. Wb2n-11 TaxID=1030533 RepID=UPI000A5DDEF9|nr:serine/threonine-protein kinase [Streptomyces sp. Wb2n-11]
MPPLRSTGTGPEAEHPDYAGQYRLEAVLGSGGMGVVHLATSGSGLRLAVKVVHADFAADPEFRARFRQEVSAARRVSGAFTAPVVDADTDAERPWMATLFIEGPTLAERVKRNGPLSTEELLRLGAGLAESLRDIHRAGVVHRDLKPSNVLLAADGPKVIDFGISRPTDSDLRTETGKLIGTPPFMAPEQFQRPREVGPAADVFAMGSVLVHAATGRGPFDSDSPYIVAYQVVHDEPDLTDVPEALVPLFTRCLAKDPADRPTPDALMAALRSAAYRTTDDTQVFIPAQRVPGGAEETAARRKPPAKAATATGAAPAAGTDAPTGPAGAVAAAPARRRESGLRRAALTVALASSLVVGGVLGVRALVDDGRPGPTPVAQRAGASETARPWSVSLSAGARSHAPACAYADGALYCSATGVKASRLNPADGKADWSEKTAGDAPRSRSDDSAPVLAGGLLHVVTPGGDRLEALDPRTGVRRWSTGIGASGGTVVLHTAKSALLAGPDGAVRAVDNTTGRTLWSERHGGVGTRWVTSPGRRGPVYATTVSDDGTSTTVVAVDPDDGEAQWEQRLSGILGPVDTSDGALFLLEDDTDGVTRAVVRLDTTARTARRVPLVAPLDQAQAAVRGNTAYLFGVNGSLIAVDMRGTGDAGGAGSAERAQRWRLETSVSRASRPVTAGGRVYLSAADGRLLAVDAADGRLLGQTTPRMGEGPYTFAASLPAPVTAPGKVFATAPDGSVFAVGDGDPARW